VFSAMRHRPFGRPGLLLDVAGPARVPVCWQGGAVGVPLGCRTEEFLAKSHMGTKKSGKGRRKIGRKKRRMRSKIRHRKK